MFLPVSRKELDERGIRQLDYIVVTGDAYVDHPTFGAAIISRVAEAMGAAVGIIAQPQGLEDIRRLGAPRRAFLVSGGNIDSMVAHYTTAKRLRSQDAYSPGGRRGLRPDRAVIAYSQLCRKAFPGTPVVLGGLEASLRRFAHYDYWDDRVRPSILLDSGADLLIYGMGELQTMELVRRLEAGEEIASLTDIRGTCVLIDPRDTPWGGVQCPDFEIVARDKASYAKAVCQQMNEQDPLRGKILLQRHGNRMLVQNPPMRCLTTEELDWVAELPYERAAHPMYPEGVPALQEVEFSLTHNRGCFGACNFCSIAFHQGRHIAVRSEESLLREAEGFLKNPRFKGFISDVGGPTANFRRPSCDHQEGGMCRLQQRRCLAPEPCSRLRADHSAYLSLLRRLRALPGVKKVFIRSGIRFDYLLAEPGSAFFEELVEHHVSGQLRVAPEHCAAGVLDCMGKPHIGAYREFSRRYMEKTRQLGKEQYLVPYLMSSHPGSTLEEAVELALFLKAERLHPDQVQDFYPTPGTVSTCMYYTGLDPFTGKQVYVPRSKEEKAMQRALLQYYLPENRALVKKALILAKREDLIGTGPGCLIPPDPRTGPAPAQKGRCAARPPRSHLKERSHDQWHEQRGRGHKPKRKSP